MPFFPHPKWDMKVDLNMQCQFPSDITITSHRPDKVVWSIQARVIHLIGLTVTSEEKMEDVFESTPS